MTRRSPGLDTPGLDKTYPSTNPRRAWLRLLAAAAVVGLLALVANVTTTAQISGEDQDMAVLRKTVSKLASSGVLWGGVAVLAGWLVRRPWQAIFAGTTSLLTALVLHYGTANLTGLMSSDTWSNNRFWFVAALVMGPTLGLIGAVSRRLDWWGLLARLVLPLGALIEPLYLGWLSPMPRDVWANRVSGVLAGCLMIVAAVVMASVVVIRWQTRRRTLSGARSTSRRG